MYGTGVTWTSLRIGLEVSTARAVEPLVGALVDKARVMNFLHQLLDGCNVAWVGGADEVVVTRLDLRHQRLKASGVLVGKFSRRDTSGVGGKRNRFAVLVGAGQKEDVLAALAHVTGEHVGGDRRVRMTQVRLGVYVVDRRCYVVGHGRKASQRRARVSAKFQALRRAHSPKLP